MIVTYLVSKRGGHLRPAKLRTYSCIPHVQNARVKRYDFRGSEWTLLRGGFRISSFFSFCFVPTATSRCTVRARAIFRTNLAPFDEHGDGVRTHRIGRSLFLFLDISARKTAITNPNGKTVEANHRGRLKEDKSPYAIDVGQIIRFGVSRVCARPNRGD